MEITKEPEEEFPEPTPEELEEAIRAFKEAAKEREAGILATAYDIRRIAAEVINSYQAWVGPRDEG